MSRATGSRSMAANFVFIAMSGVLLILPFLGLQIVFADALEGRCTFGASLEWQWTPFPGQYCVEFLSDGSRVSDYAILA